MDHMRYRKHFWPAWNIDSEEYQDLQIAYQSVRDSGIPNSVGERVLLDTQLNIPAWEKHLKEEKYADILDGIKYGFNSGFLGPITTMDMSEFTDNHLSANQYPSQVDEFIRSEIEMGSLKGPFDKPPFEFSHISPLMSKEKSDKNKRRIISDLKHPEHISVNGYIPSNTILGKTKEHKLPKTDDVVQYIRDKKDYWLSSIDLKSAYKHWNCCPSDYPLFTIKWKEKYYFEATIPFGAKNSSLIQQTISNAILDILQKQGIKGFMYLDDLLLVSIGKQKAEQDKKYVENLFTELGIKMATEKSEGPTKELKWIGIIFNVNHYTLRMPANKIQELIDQISSVINRKYITKNKMQSIIGRVMHVSKCIIPSRIFSSRLLQALRDEDKGRIYITNQVKMDMLWFLHFANIWNGTSFMNMQYFTRTIYTITQDGVLIATDLSAIYIIQTLIAGKESQWKLEVLNIASAMDVFQQDIKTEGKIKIVTTNNKAATAFNTGNTRDNIIDSITRDKWFEHSLNNRDYRVDHYTEVPPQIEMIKNVALNGMENMPQLLDELNIVQVHIDCNIINKLIDNIISRQNPHEPDDSCSDETATSQGSWHHKEFRLYSEAFPYFHI